MRKCQAGIFNLFLALNRLGETCPFLHEGEQIKYTEVCKFHRTGFCTKGEECPFSHGISVSNRITHFLDLHSEACKFMVAKGFCREPSCPYSHDLDIVEQTRHDQRVQQLKREEEENQKLQSEYQRRQIMEEQQQRLMILRQQHEQVQRTTPLVYNDSSSQTTIATTTSPHIVGSVKIPATSVPPPTSTAGVGNDSGLPFSGLLTTANPVPAGHNSNWLRTTTTVSTLGSLAIPTTTSSTQPNAAQDLAKYL